ncbi:MAG: hypothetical protein ABI650_11815 [Dokdonella sp.]
MHAAAVDLSFWISEIDSSVPATALFVRKFGHPPPQHPHHLAAFHLGVDGVSTLACYVHFWSFGDIVLGGGACVDDRVLRRLDASQRERLRAQGGLYRLVLDYAVHKFSAGHSAIFGFCGDRRAEAVDRAAGFVSTEHAKLLVYWARDLHPLHQAALVAKAHALGPF